MAREFDGVDDFISYSHISAFDGIAAIAISCWIRPEDGGSNWSGPFDAMGASTGEGTTHGWAVQKEDADETTCFLAFRNANADAVQGLTGSLTLSTWRHLYIRYDGSLAGDQRLRFWVDGVQNSATNANTPATLGTNDQVFQLAKSEGTLFWKGALAEIGIWLDASEARIADLAAGKAPSFYQTNLHIYLPLISGDGAVDVRGNAGSPSITGTTEVAHPAGITYPSSRTDGRIVFRQA